MAKLNSLVNNWIEERPYLEEIGKLHLAINQLLEQQEANEVSEPDWNNSLEDFKRGIPVFKAKEIDSNFVVAASSALMVLSKIAECEELPEKLKDDAKKLNTYFTENESAVSDIITGLLQEKDQLLSEHTTKACVSNSIVWFLGWTAISYTLKPFKKALEKWQLDNGWQTNYCPTCGNLPVMAQLARSGKGRQRKLVCGCCQTSWFYKRICCPYCETEVQEHLEVLEVEQEEDIRIDTCNNCESYIKVYTNQGEEEVLLADYFTIHLDLLMKEKGLHKMGQPLLTI